MDRTAPGTVELPDSYAKEAGSNNNKWMLLDQLAFDAINKNYEDVYESTDITKAYGATLDKFGQWLDQKRGQLNDPQYRFMLLTKILRNLSKGTAGDVIKLISRMLHASPADIKIAEVYPAKINILSIPYSGLMEAGFDSNQAITLIALLLPLGVGITAAKFEGTFQFGTEASEYDEKAGFADIHQSIGGTLGIILDDLSDFELPL